ncbi:MAG: ATP-binding protein [Myxococcota bacterium]
MYNRSKIERKKVDLRDLRIPALVFLLVAAWSLALWGLLVADRREQVLATTRRTAWETQAALEEGFDQQLEQLGALRDGWSRFGLGSQAEWQENMRQRLESLPGLASIVWVDAASDRSRFIAAPGESDAAIRRDLAHARAPISGDRLEGPARASSGEAQYRIRLPLSGPDGHAGVLQARFDVTRFLDDLLKARALGFVLSVWWDEEEIFERGERVADDWLPWWRVDGIVSLPLDRHWTIVHRPTPAFAAERLSPTPHYLLGAGLLLGVMLAVVAYQFLLIVRQSKVLAASNRALEQRGVELESRVAERTEALRDAVTELESFNYSVSHDLRSPLGAIQNFAAILEEDYRDRPLDGEGQALIARIQRSARRATMLLEDLLQLSRAGRAALTFEPVDMRALAWETIAQVRAAEREGEGEVEFVVESLPIAMGDRTLLGDVFVNLIGNAVKYTRGCEKRRIVVTGRVVDDECTYEVSDNGQGFDMRYVDKVFGLFERLHAQDDVEGTGIGLAMVARIVKRHGGRVWAEGRIGEGARFSFALPGWEGAR